MFVDRFRALLHERFEQAKDVPRDELDAAIAHQLSKAEYYGLTSEQSAATFVMSAWLLGPDFDTEFPALNERLTNQRLSEHEKAKWLEVFTVGLLDALEQPKDERPI